MNTANRYCAILCASIALSSTAPCFADQQPNILFIVADDLNDFISVLTPELGVKTPNIDKLASKSTVFTNAHSNAPVCSPSRASFLSGILPHQSGQYNFGHWRHNEMLKNSKTIMELLSEGGYYTLGTGKIMHHQWPKAWDHFETRPDYTPLAFNGVEKVVHPNMPHPYSKKVGPLDATFIRLSNVPSVKPNGDRPGYDGWYYGGFKKPFRYNNPSDRDLLPDEIYANWGANTIARLDQEQVDKPFFMSVGLIRPHTPLVVPDRFFDMYPLSQLALPELPKGDDLDTHFEKIYAPKESLGRKHYRLLVESYGDKKSALKHYYQAYMASVSFMDEQVGKLLTALNNSRFSEETIVVFTSDHGYTLGEKDNLFKNNLWERSTRIPLIIYDPSNKRHQTINDAVSLVDLYPTFAELANVQLNNRKNENGGKLDGISLVPLLEGNDQSDRAAITVVKPANSGPNFAIRTTQWRYIRYSDGNEELYNHANDPQEHHNIADDKNYYTIKKKLAARLARQTLGAK